MESETALIIVRGVACVVFFWEEGGIHHFEES